MGDPSRDYDVMFLLARTQPDYDFLAARCGIHDLEQLKTAVEEHLQSADLRKQRNFEHLLFRRDNSKRILHLKEFICSL